MYNQPRMKSGITIALAALVALVLAGVAAGEPVSQLKPTDYVNDFAHVLDGPSIAQLDNLCAQIDQKAHAQIAVVTIHSLDGGDIESYAVDLFKQWGVGSKSTNRGVLILLAVGDHRYRVEVGYGLEPILPDGKVGGFGREAVPLLRAERLQSRGLSADCPGCGCDCERRGDRTDRGSNPRRPRSPKKGRPGDSPWVPSWGSSSWS